ncbi:cytochrome P450 [Ktedonosporobacter rubrisoli]|uniref:Cytochrome P450 n=1 Tax=Ktedonosporobacter rubrisoli TaxID=2509675 RepID=A0A4V0YYN5_KTERU|nr:cytochrome P450 [Ktedonosporobacter rubrisoli]QBD76841.1 cytochrome P450 [Ktedonosporobacter rubrisoli]
MEQITLGDLYGPETIKNPFTLNRKLRGRKEPLVRIEGVPEIGFVWLAADYEDVIAILRDPRFVKDRLKFMPPQSGQDAAADDGTPNVMMWWRNMLTVDPPDHTRLRGLVSKAFTPRMIEQLRPQIQHITDELLDKVQPQGKMDLIADFAYPLPMTVISDMLGIPVSDRQQFRDWSRTLMSMTTTQQGAAPELAAIVEVFVKYIQDLLEARREHPGTDLTSALIQAHDQGDSLSETELISTIWLLILAGHETTVSLIGNGMLSLFQHPEQLDMLRKDPTKLPAAIEELLRYAGPIQFVERLANEDVKLHNQVIHRGEMVLLSLSMANLDPHQFSGPESLNITREENKQLAFGKGIHACLGAPLARLEGQIAIGTLLKRLPGIRLAIEPEQAVWAPSQFRGLASLPVTF